MNRTQWWIDYIEEETTPTEKQDMELLLGNSSEHRAICQGLAATRRSIKSLDPVREPAGEDFYNHLHLSVMARLTSSQDEDVASASPLSKDIERSKKLISTKS